MRIIMLMLLLLSGCLQEEGTRPEAWEELFEETPLPPVEEQVEKPPSKTLSLKVLWNFTTGDKVYGVALSDANRAAVGSLDGHVYLLDRDGKLLWRFKARGGVHDVAMSSPVGYVAALSYTYDETTVHLLDKDGRELWSLAVPKLSRGVDVSASGEVAVASSTGKIYLINKSIRWTYNLEESVWGAWDVVFAGDRVIAVDDNADIYYLSMDGSLLGKTRVAEKDYIYGVAAAPGGYVAVVTQNKSVYLYRDGKLLWKRKTDFSNYGVAISPGSEFVAAGSWDKNLYIYDISGKLLLKHHVGDSVNRVAFSEGHLIYGSGDGSAYLAEVILEAQMR